MQSRITLAILFFGLLPIFTLAQTQSPAAPSQDSQAIAILNQSLNAVGGWAAIAAVQDYTGQGNVAYNWAGQQVQGPVTVYSKGLDEFRMDANVSGGTQTLIVNSGQGALIPVSGAEIPLSCYTILRFDAVPWPSARIATALADSNTTLVYVGLVTWNGSQVYDVRVIPPIDPSLTMNGALNALGVFDLYLDQTSSLVLGLSETAWTSDAVPQSYYHEFQFSNYASASGLSVPLTIVEQIGGQITWSMTLTTVTFNSGLSDDLFSL